MKFIISIVTYFLICTSTSAQWQRVQGPHNGKTKGLIKNGSDIYACFEGGGIHLSSDKGQKWELISRNLSEIDVHAIAHNGKTLFAGTDSGIFTTIDNGKNWNVLNSIFYNQNINYIGVHNNLILVCSNSNLFISIDDGQTWNICNFGISLFKVTKSLIVNKTIYVSTDGAGVFYTTDTGKQWHTAGNLGLGFEVKDMFYKNNILYAGTTNGLLSCKLDDLIWNYIHRDFLNYFAFAYSENGEQLYCGTADGTKVSNTNGTTWLSANSGIEGQKVKKLLIVDGVLIAGLDNKAIYTSPDNGYNWTHTSIGINSSYNFYLSSIDNRIFTNSEEIALEVSDDKGLSWQTMDLPEVTDRVYKITQHQGKYYAISNNRYLHVSGDKGKTWESIFLDFPAYYLTDITSKSGYLFAINFQGQALRSGNNGSDWVQIPIGIENLTCRKIEKFNNNLIVYHNEGISISYNNGDNWLTYTDIMKSVSVNKLVNMGTIIIAGTSIDGIYISKDSTRSWNSMNQGLNNYVINDLTIHDGYIFIATNGGVYYSSDTAKNWIQVNENLSNLLISQITVLDGHLFVTTLGDGIWKRQIWETTDLNKISRVQYKVYPNPTNGFFSLETSDNIKQISVYDVMGNELQVIKNQFEDSITKMDLTHLAPGIYFIKLQTDKGSAIEKIIIQ